jgi:hypothetical protein
MGTPIPSKKKKGTHITTIYFDTIYVVVAIHCVIKRERERVEEDTVNLMLPGEKKGGF